MAQTISTKYATQLSNGVRWARAYVYIIDDDTFIYDNTNLINIKIQTQLQNDKNIFGNTVCKYAVVKISNPGNSLYSNLIGKRLGIYVGLTIDIGLETESVEYLNQGIFRILDVKQDADNEALTLECYDGMVRFNVPYDEAGTYPMTLADFAAMLCSSVGLELGSTNFGNSTMVISEAPNVAQNEYQKRSLLGWAAELAGGNALMGIDNKVYIKNYGSSSSFTITPALYIDQNISPLFGPINGVAMVREALGDTVYYPDPLPTNGSTFRIIDNMINYNNRETIINSIFTSVNGTQYYPFNLKWRGTGHLQFMDKITLTDTNSATYDTYVMNSILSFDGSLSEELSAFAYTPTASAVKTTSAAASKIKLTEVKVNKIEGEISLIAADIDTLEGNYSQLLMDVNGITTTVNQQVDNLNSLSTTVNQNATNLDIQINSLNDMKTYYQYTADSLTIGKSSSPAQISIGYDSGSKPQMILDDGSNNTAVINSDTMTINNVKVSGSTEMGNHKVQKLTGSSVITIFLPIGV